MQSTMPKVLIWDLPVRLFHLVFAGGFVAAAVIALVLGDDGPLFPYHGMIGLTVGVALALRAVWGVIGSRHARFASFAYGPAAVIRFMASTLRGKGERFAGHNPGASHTMLAMFALMAALVATGVMLGLGNEGVKEAHEFLSYAMVLAVIAHLAGLALHTVMHRELIAASMVHGRKQADPSEAIGSAHAVAGVMLALVTAGFAAALWANFDRATATTRIPLVGTTISLGEVEHAEGEHGGREDEDDD